MRTGSPFVIAEAGVNHNGDARLAVRLVDAAADAGADAVKFQTFRAEALASAGAPKAAYQKKSTGGRGSQLEMLRRLELSEDGHRRALARARKRGIAFLSTPFDEKSADFLARLGVKAFKLPSGELTNHPLLARVASKRRPVILSTGMSTLAEVAAAVKVLRRGGVKKLTLLHCVSNYPADPADSNLRAMATMARAFKVPVGWSDHTTGSATAVAAVALGAAVLEKHFTLDKRMKGPDHAMSLEPRELAAFVASVREAASALGDGIKRPVPSEAAIRRVARRSLVLTAALPKGARLRAADLSSKRPGTGIPPSELASVVGRRLRRAVPADRPLTREDLA